MLIIGITGGTGAGKTTALRALEALGALVLDCDAIYHELLSDNTGLKSELGIRFHGVLNDGVIDREVLGGIVFGDRNALLELNAITHKYVGAEIERRIINWQDQGGTIAAIDAIALIESGRAKKCDIVVGVTAPQEIRLSRIMERDGITREQAEMRINAQKSDAFFIENCDYILEGKYETSAEFEKVCKEFFVRFLS